MMPRTRSKQQQQQQQQQRQPAAESWDDFHQQYHSEQFRNSANNPSILRRIGHVPKSFGTRRESSSSRSLVDQVLLMRTDSTSSLGGSSHSGSDRGRGNASFRRDESHKSQVGGRRKSQGNIKIGATPKSKKWSFAGLFRK